MQGKNGLGQEEDKERKRGMGDRERERMVVKLMIALRELLLMIQAV